MKRTSKNEQGANFDRDSAKFSHKMVAVNKKMTEIQLDEFLMSFHAVTRRPLRHMLVMRYMVNDIPFVVKCYDENNNICLNIKLNKQKLHEFNSRYSRFAMKPLNGYCEKNWACFKMEDELSDKIKFNFLAESYHRVFCELCELLKVIYSENSLMPYFSIPQEKLNEILNIGLDLDNESNQ